MSLKSLYNITEEPQLAGQSDSSHGRLQTPPQPSKYRKLKLVIHFCLMLKPRIPGALPPHDVVLKSKGKVNISWPPYCTYENGTVLLNERVPVD